MLRTVLSAVADLFRSRSDLILENLALRQQLTVLTRHRPRPRMSAGGRFFWVALRRVWRNWRQVLVVVRPETVVRWHRLGFRAYWRWRSRPRRREAFAYDAAPRFLILDGDGFFDRSLFDFLRALGITPARTAPRSPWQNGVVERWIGSVRRELLDHVVVFHERHLHRLLSDYVAYYLDDRPHLALAKDAPSGRPVERPPRADAEIVSYPRVGGLHHRYRWRMAA